MEAASCVRVCAVLAAFASAALIVPEVGAALRHVQAVNRANHAAFQTRSGFMAYVLRNGFAPATTLAASLSRHRGVSAFCEDVLWLARHRGYETDATRASGVAIAASLAMVPLGWFASTSPIFGLMAAICLLVGLGAFARHAREREIEAMREEVPEMLHALGACFHAGYSLLQAFQYLARESHGPLARFFERAKSDLETGRTATETLERMREASALPELAFVAAALEIQHQTGGSLQKVLDCARDSIEGELALRRSLRVQTAQARLSMRVVTIMPFALMAVFSLVSPEFLAPFFSSGLGIAVFCAATGMQVTGVLIVRRMLDVKEG